MKYDAATGLMCFGTALESLKKGGSVARTHWHGIGMHIEKSWNGDEIILHVQRRFTTLWMPSQEDVLAEDWKEVYA